MVATPGPEVESTTIGGGTFGFKLPGTGDEDKPKQQFVWSDDTPPPSLTWHVSAGDVASDIGDGQKLHLEPEAANNTSDDDYVDAHDDGTPATVLPK